ncbi:phosphoesterase [Marinitenerispora sediminis]|uniref:Phosphoesterase n=2 Tax=Marinitenerispora sediminis TaxID=1931232 RepID=A0A368SYZ0_9ACTN|nr:phosphoesterase [Marinitenerispora sediminis]RCV50339.1 phosphoesterase [Marinitenerispora sediminis]RCV51580.1 phosphoesterase [Marinitenerispora sediminis]
MAAGAVSLTAFAVLTAAFAVGGGHPAYQGLDAAVTAEALTTRGAALTWLAVLLHHLGGWPWTGVLVAAVAVPLLAVRRWPAALLVAGSWLATSAVLVPWLKHLVDRARPVEQLVPMASPAFPSGHAAFAAVLGMAVVAVVPRHRGWVLAGALVWTALMAWSRIYLGVHWFSDTLAGALLGWGVALLAWGIADPRGSAAPSPASAGNGAGPPDGPVSDGGAGRRPD